MKTYIRDLKLRVKVSLLVGIPLLGLIVFSSLVIYNNFTVFNQTRHFKELADLVLISNELVHQIQQERDFSVMAISNKGQKTLQQLQTQYKMSDEKLSKLKLYLKNIDRNNFSESLLKTIDSTQSQLDNLATTRSQVSAFEIGIDKIMPYYREVIESLLSLDNEFVLLSPNSEASGLAMAYGVFMEIKETASRERAELTFAFANDSFRPGMHIKLLNLINLEENSVAEFEQLASEEYEQEFHSKMQHPAVHELIGLRELAVDKAVEGKFGVDPALWFRLASEKHNLLYEVERGLEHSIHVLVDTFASQLKKNLIIGVSSILILMFLTIYLAWLISSTIIKPIMRAVEVAKLISAGDLRDINVSNSSHSDEIGVLLGSLRDMQLKLTEVIRSSKVAAATVKRGAEEIWQGSSNLNERTDQQAANLQETTASMEEMAGTVRQNADNSKQASQLAKAAREQAEKGGEVVGRAVYAMNKINESSKKIADIISVIDEIAFQTNLLALNAAVEAARAGEQGRGFAVVASEVRNLAGRSATAAKEIKRLIEDSVEKVTEGSKLVNSSGQLLSEIVGSVKKVSDIIAEIASAGQEQSTGIDQVSLAVSQMDELTQRNSAMVQESSKASEAMGNQATSLNDILGFFKIENEPESVSRSIAPPRSSENIAQLKRPPTSVASSKKFVSNSASAVSHKPKQKAASGGSADEWESF